MRASTILMAALATTAWGAPAYPEIAADATEPRSLESLSEYFSLLASKVQAHRHTSWAPQCDLSLAKMPSPAEDLPPVSSGLHLKHVAVGRGTQNYTCDAGNATAAPEAAGAVATLFNVSCVAAAQPDLLDLIPGVSMLFDLSAGPLSAGRDSPGRSRLGPSSALFAGDHFFHDGKTPFFHLQENGDRIGDAYCGLNSSTPAPAGAASGPKGEPAVPWLKLLAKEGTTDDIREVYRLTTAGGTAPKTCGGMDETFQVQYAAAYWFYAGPAPAEHEEDDDDE